MQRSPTVTVAGAGMFMLALLCVWLSTLSKVSLIIMFVIIHAVYQLVSGWKIAGEWIYRCRLAGSVRLFHSTR